jgi:hypothetical protein
VCLEHYLIYIAGSINDLGFAFGQVQSPISQHRVRVIQGYSVYHFRSGGIQHRVHNTNGIYSIC